MHSIISGFLFLLQFDLWGPSFTFQYLQHSSALICIRPTVSEWSWLLGLFDKGFSKRKGTGYTRLHLWNPDHGRAVQARLPALPLLKSFLHRRVIHIWHLHSLVDGIFPLSSQNAYSSPIFWFKICFLPFPIPSIPHRGNLLEHDFSIAWYLSLSTSRIYKIQVIQHPFDIYT